MTREQRNKTTVVNVRIDEFDVYIGRAMRARRLPDPRCRARSVFANPYRVGRKYGRTRQQALAEYEALWRRRLASKSRRLWRERLLALEGQRLGCWCWPQPCHGDVLVRLIGEYKDQRSPGSEDSRIRALTDRRSVPQSSNPQQR